MIQFEITKVIYLIDVKALEAYLKKIKINLLLFFYSNYFIFLFKLFSYEKAIQLNPSNNKA